MRLQNLVTAARALVACNHPVARVQTFALVRAGALATLARCQVCGAIRLDGGRWLATLGTVVIERELDEAEQFVAAVVRVALIAFSDLIVYECEVSDPMSPGAHVRSRDLRSLLAVYVAAVVKAASG